MQPVYQINEYLLGGNNKLAELMGYDGTNIRPIFPAQQTPESNLNLKPFMVYSTRTSTKMNEWWTHIEDITYMIWSKSIDAIDEVGNELIDVLRRMDDSAEELNDYLFRRGYDDYRFYYVRLISQGTPAPIDSEADRYGKPITFRCEYTNTHGRGLT